MGGQPPHQGAADTECKVTNNHGPEQYGPKQDGPNRDGPKYRAQMGRGTKWDRWWARRIGMVSYQNKHDNHFSAHPCSNLQN